MKVEADHTWAWGGDCWSTGRCGLLTSVEGRKERESEEGIIVNIASPTVFKIELLMHAANFGNPLGGLSGYFSSKSVCKFCHIQFLDLETRIHDCDGDQAHSKWIACPGRGLPDGHHG